jgi:hypothetical protein
MILTLQASDATCTMRNLPAFARPLLHWFLPQRRTLRKTVRTALEYIEIELAKRERTRLEAAARGKTVPKDVDALQWFYEVAKRKGREYDIALGQLQLSFAAIHTMSITLGHVMFDLVSDPEYNPLIRVEIVAAFRETG